MSKWYANWDFELDEPTLQMWMMAFPDVDIIVELSFMDEWLLRHPRRIGTKRFVANWLKAEQRKVSATKAEARVGTNPFTNVHVKADYLAKKGEKHQ